MAKFGVIGIGLIGGSIAKALPGEVIVCDENVQSLLAAEALGIEATNSIDLLVNLVDVVFIATPYDTYGEVLALVFSAASRREKPIVVTTVNSVMLSEPVDEPNVIFINGHPMAGTEHSGFDSAKAELFECATWVLSNHHEQLEEIVRKLGAKPLIMHPLKHNAVVGQVSHLVHVLAAAQILALPESDFFSLAASSFRDSTRVASTRPELTTDMVDTNGDEVLHALKRLSGVLEEFTEAIEEGDADRIYALFERAKRLRDANL